MYEQDAGRTPQELCLAVYSLDAADTDAADKLHYVALGGLYELRRAICPSRARRWLSFTGTQGRTLRRLRPRPLCLADTPNHGGAPMPNRGHTRLVAPLPGSAPKQGKRPRVVVLELLGEAEGRSPNAANVGINAHRGERVGGEFDETRL